MLFFFDVLFGWLPYEFQVVGLAVISVCGILLVLKLVAKVIEALPFI